MKFTDIQRLDFLEKWEVSQHNDSWFTLLTQRVSKKDCPNLREFCDYAIAFERMIDSNELDVLAWHYLPSHLQEMVMSVWEEEARPLTAEEKVSLQEESDKYWEELHQIEMDNSDK
jgi:hypothetical protein